MTDIPNTEYITLKRDDTGKIAMFVGGKQTTQYRGHEIQMVIEKERFIRDVDDEIERIFECHNGAYGYYPDVEEVHVLSSETFGEPEKFGTPSGKHGNNTWCRVKFKNNSFLSPWACMYTSSKEEDVSDLLIAFSYYFNHGFRCIFGGLCDGGLSDKASNSNAMKVEIPNTDYITVKRDADGNVGTYVGGEATSYYHFGIRKVDDVVRFFQQIQCKYPDVEEVHVLASKTEGEIYVRGNPLPVLGGNVWCRAKLKNSPTANDWVFFYGGGYLYGDCAWNCLYNIYSDDKLGDAVVLKPEVQKLKGIDLSQLTEKPIELNGYRIVVEKIGPKTK